MTQIQNKELLRIAEPSGWSFDRQTYTWSSRKSSHSWNPADFMKSGGFHHEIRRISPWNQMFQQKLFWFYKVWGGFHEIRRISYGFHEIRRISCEIERPLQGIVTLCLKYLLPYLLFCCDKRWNLSFRISLAINCVWLIIFSIYPPLNFRFNSATHAFTQTAMFRVLECPPSEATHLL